MIKTITSHITYVGVDNTSETFFENQYPLTHGMAYNSYVAADEKIAVIDAVEAGMEADWKASIDRVLGDRRPDYLVVQHMEPDHSAGIAHFMEQYPEARIVTSTKAKDMLGRFFHGHTLNERIIEVKDGDTISLGTISLRFIAAPMIHWPEVLTTYIPEEKVLFTADAFGKFGTVEYKDDWINEARRYYVNIVGKYGAQVQNYLKKAAALDIAVIAPLHGPVLTENLPYYLDLYNKWSSYTPEVKGVLVAYASIYGNTRRAAEYVAEGLRSRGVETVTFDLCRQDMSEALAQAFRMSTMVLASVTYDAGMFPAMHDFIHHLSIKGLKGRTVALIENGSWAPAAARLMRDQLQQIRGMEVLDNVLTIRSAMNEDDHAAAEAFIAAVASNVK